jgi:hypothetical protein
MKRVLSFLNLIDSEGNLSITNAAVIICVTKMAIMPTFSMTEVTALLVAMLNYAHKRATNNDQV